MSVTRRKDGLYGYVQLNNPPMNAIGQNIRQELLDAVDWAEAEGLERVILTGEGRAFSAGADANEFGSDPQEPHLPDVLNRIENSTVSWIAAIHGPALGGGMELAMACRYRISTPNALLGLPEVNLGVIAGAGGIQRLPRLVGMTKALEMLPVGKTISGTVAKSIGLVDDLDDEPVYAAEMVNTEWLGMAVPVGELNIGETSSAEFEAARATAKKRLRGQNAPLVTIDLLEKAGSLPLHDAIDEDRTHFIALRKSPQATALRHAFFAERGAKTPKWLTATPANVSQIVVVGGGTMGAAIAYAMLNAGYKVTLIETDAEGVQRARSNVQHIIDDGVKRGLLSDAKVKNLHDCFTTSHDYADAANADLAIEAAFESMEVKNQIFGQLQTVMRPDAILATNTSYLDVNEIAATLDDPSRLIGLHFFAPAHIMKLLEIVRGKDSSDVALAAGFALGKKLRKIPVLSGVCDGFIGNRILARYREAADTLLMDGTNPWELDEAMVEFGYAMGPYEAQDLSGLDIAHANRRRQDATRDPKRRYIPIADRMVTEGRLGRKVSVGWYRYPGGRGKVVDPLIEDLVREEAHFAKVKRVTFTDAEIRERLLLAMINEAANILFEGIAENAADIDLVTIFGYGFPRWRGGLMHYADTLGAKSIYDALCALEKEDPIAWAPSPLIKDCAKNNSTFAGWTK